MMEIFSEPYMPNPYPEHPDDGTWEGEGGYVAKPDHVVWKMRQMNASYYPYGEVTFKEVLIAHPLTVAEINYAIGKQR